VSLLSKRRHMRKQVNQVRNDRFYGRVPTLR